MPLGIEGFTYADLYAPSRLSDLYDEFCQHAAEADAALWTEWEAYRTAPDEPRPALVVSDLIVRMAPHVSRFIGRLFQVEMPAGEVRAQTFELDTLFRFKTDFVRGRAALLVKGGAHVPHDPADAAVVTRLVAPFSNLDGERAVAAAGCALLDREAALGESGSDPEKAAVAADIDALKRWCASHLHDPPFSSWVTLRFPERRRDGFTLTDARWGTREVLDHVHYCVLCHERDEDSCSKGLRDKTGTVLSNPLGIPLNGCPLDEKISEMHMARKAGDVIGALAIVVLDNPMVPGTGHGICDDCMKACIYQQQEPVNIPQIETGVLADVLQLPWGVEIYGLLTRWNPLHVKRPFALPYNGRNVLVVGFGPAGYTLAHYLLNEGFGVVAIDDSTIEQLPAPLHFTLARRDRLRIYDGKRFGATMQIEDTWGHWFDHIAFASSAGKSVVMAMASAKHGYQHVVALFDDGAAAADPGAQSGRDAKWSQLVQRLDDE